MLSLLIKRKAETSATLFEPNGRTNICFERSKRVFI